MVIHGMEMGSRLPCLPLFLEKLDHYVQKSACIYQKKYFGNNIRVVHLLKNKQTKQNKAKQSKAAKQSKSKQNKMFFYYLSSHFQHILFSEEWHLNLSRPSGSRIIDQNVN